MALAAVMILFIAAYTLVVHSPITNRALADSQRIVSLHVDGKTKIIPTTAATVGELIDRAGVNLASGDLVEPSLDTLIAPGSFNINVYRSRAVVVQDGETTVRGFSAYVNPRLIIQHLGIELFIEDIVSTSPVTDLVGDDVLGQKFTITRAKPFTLTADGSTRAVRTQKTTVTDALLALKIPLGPDDIIEPSPSAPVSLGMNVSITRIKDSQITVDEAIEFEVQRVLDNQLAAGHEAVRVEGKNGKRQVVYAVHFENGQEVSRQILSSNVTEQPVTKVIAVGTKITDDVWYRLRVCESGNNYANRNNSTYRGAYQISFSTWGGYGGYSDPADAPPAVQDAKAKLIQASQGWGAWGGCASSLGLI